MTNMAEERNRSDSSDKSAAILQFESRKQKKDAEQKAHSERLAKIGRARHDIVGPAIQSMRKLGFDNTQIAAILEHAIKLLCKDNPSNAS
jgi:hypothetical protein